MKSPRIWFNLRKTSLFRHLTCTQLSLQTIKFLLEATFSGNKRILRKHISLKIKGYTSDIFLDLSSGDSFGSPQLCLKYAFWFQPRGLNQCSYHLDGQTCEHWQWNLYMIGKGTLYGFFTWQSLTIKTSSLAEAENMADLIDGYCRLQGCLDTSLIILPNRGENAIKWSFAYGKGGSYMICRSTVGM